jgi:hypothetical protein
MPHFIERAQDRHVAPAAGQAEARHLELDGNRQILDERRRTVMRLGRRLPAFVERIEE